MKLWTDAVPAEDQDGEEPALQKKREDALGGQRRAEDVAHKAGVHGPVGAELELHDDAGGHADGKIHGEDLGPEPRGFLVEDVAGAEEHPFEIDHHGPEPDGQRGEEVVEHDGQRELTSREGDDVELGEKWHGGAASGGGRRRDRGLPVSHILALDDNGGRGSELHGGGENGMLRPAVRPPARLSGPRRRRGVVRMITSR